MRLTRPISPSTLLLLALLTGCAAGDDSPCDSTAECFKGQVCKDNACVYGALSLDGEQTNNATNNTTPTQTSATTGGVCTGAASACADDPQEQTGSQHHVVRPSGDLRYVGCSSFATDAQVQTIDATLQGTLCAGDRFGDTYGLEFGWCRQKRTTITMTLTLDEPCAPSDLEIIWDALCEDVRHDCQTTQLDAATWRVTVTTATTASPTGTQFVNLRFKGLRDDLQVGYSLRVQAEEFSP